MNLNDDFAFSHCVVQGMPGATGVRVGIIENSNDKIAFINHVLVAVEVGVVTAFFCRNRMHKVGFFEDGFDFLASGIVAFVGLGNFQKEVWICLLFFKDDLARPGVNAECVTGDEMCAAFCN